MDVAPHADVRESGLGSRLPAPDAARGAALIGVVIMNYLGYTLLQSPRLTWGSDGIEAVFDPWTGPLSTRFAATFVLVAGVGISLLTRRGDVAQLRERLVRRGLALYVAGLLIDLVWPGTIIVYYGAMFVLAAWMFTLRTRTLAGIATSAALAGWLIEWWVEARSTSGNRPTWLTSPDDYSPSWFLFELVINGTHPLLPWLAFLCVGMVLGRAQLAARDTPSERPRWQATALAAGIGLFVAATATRMILGNDDASASARRIWSTDPFDRGLMYTMSALGTALIAYVAIDALARAAPRAAAPLSSAGQLSLTIYLAHIAVYEVARRTELFLPTTFWGTMAYAVTFWVAAIAAGTWWQRRHGRGPAERVYRWIGG